MPKSESDAPAPMKRVKCVARNRPWTHEAPLEFGQEAVVPAEVAEAMAAREQVFVLGDA